MPAFNTDQPHLLKIIATRYRELSYSLFFNRCILYGYVYLYSSIRSLPIFRRRRFWRAAIVFPRQPARSQGLWKALKLSAIPFFDYDAQKLNNYDSTVLFIRHDSPDGSVETKNNEIPDSVKARALNGHLDNIAKDHVQKIFQETFGRPLGVDPMQFEGYMVRKSKRNATHDGLVLKGPIDVDDYDPDYAYEVLVNNTVADNTVVDMRIAVVGNELPLAWLRYRPISTRFSNKSRVELVQPDDILSNEEIRLIILYARKMGVDFAEMDILRDSNSKQIFIVDVNPTPCAPSALGQGIRGIIAMHRLARAFERQFVVGPVEGKLAGSFQQDAERA